MDSLRIDGRSLTLSQLAALAGGALPRIELDPRAVEAVRAARAVVDGHVEAGDVVYGVTTGFGRLKDTSIPLADLERLQRNLILSHCCTLGEPMPIEEVRIAQVLRLNGLARGHSGVRIETLQALTRFLERDFVPVVPRQGSVGASGDLAPLAQMTAAYLGEGEVWLAGRRMGAASALAAIGEAPLRLAAKEGLALINGTEVMKATGCVAHARATRLSKAADAILALTIEARRGSARPFEERLVELKGDPGHGRCARNVRACLDGSQVLPAHAACGRVQDPYSLRCAPQVHGAFKNALAHVTEVLAREINAVTDNPVVFPGSGEVLSAGLFHGQPLSMALDYLGLALASLASISERRIEQLVNPDLSGLPAFLTPEPGLNSGLMIVQVAAAALVSENKVYAHPASVDSIPTSAGQEDHVSMGVTAARKARAIVENAERVLAMEWLCAAQGREFGRDLAPGRGAQAAYAALRQVVPPLVEDRYLKRDIDAALLALLDGSLLTAVEGEVGPLDP